eukprot:TRINITY_DN4779_c0_g2_i7.p1 TRINITY_DN4779_c0_g2~~TRINITY_DN4779_c0_g2_i7.p1  ORF type:complete len:312 (+),score=42.09 TRINITY_DN4779_c0_g2_i7:81-1016(+)
MCIRDRCISVEICGDGIHLGQVECDDGNTKSGDGCSSDCKIEKSYSCISYSNGPSTCFNIEAPTASLKLSGDNLLPNADSGVLTSKMTVTLKNTREPCKLSWELQTDFPASSTIKVNPQCSLQGSHQLYIVTFENPSLIPSADGNLLITTVLQANARYYKYTSSGETTIMDIVGGGFASVSTATLLLMVGVSLFQSTAMGSLWTFVNMLQLLFYLPGLNCFIPYNLEVFLTEYLSIKDIAIPFNMIPDFPLNSVRCFEFFATSPLSERLLGIGYADVSFVLNFSDEILTWTSLAAVYLVLTLLCSAVSRNK